MSALGVLSRLRRPAVTRRLDALAVAGAAILGLFVLAAAIGPYVAPYSWQAIGSELLSPPSARHLLGTTNLGQDLLSQVLVGSRWALIIGLSAAVSVVTAGTLVGLLAGYYRGIVDGLLMRLVDLAYALPLEPIAIVLLAVVSRSMLTIVVVISLLSWRGPARVIRAQTLSIAERPFVKAARVAGAGEARTMVVHVAPNVLPIALLYLPIAFGQAVMAEASISFLGFGDPNHITWGQILQLAFAAGAARTAWWWVLAPGACIVAVFFLSRSFEDSLNPRLRAAAR